MHLARSLFASGSLFLLSSSLVNGVALHGPYRLRSRDAKLPIVSIDQEALGDSNRHINASYFPDGIATIGFNTKYHYDKITVTRGVQVSKDGKATGINWCPEKPDPPPHDDTVYWCLDIRPKDGPLGEVGGPDNGNTLRIDMRKNTANPSIFDGPHGFTTQDKSRCTLRTDWLTADKQTPKGPGDSPGNQRTWECTLPAPWVTLAGASNSTSNSTAMYATTQSPKIAGTEVSDSPPVISLSPLAKYLNTTANSTNIGDATSTSSNSDNSFSSSTTTHSSDSPTNSPDAEEGIFNWLHGYVPVSDPEVGDHDHYLPEIES